MCKTHPKTFLKRFYLSSVSLHNENHSNFKAGLSDDFARTLWSDTHLVTGLFIMEEIWKDIIGYEGLYKISSFGRIKSKHTNNKWGSGWKLLNGYRDNLGYLYTALFKEGNRHIFKIHRLVALHFIPNSENKPQVNHIDADKTNNRIENLKWCSALENMRHAFAKNLIPFRIGGANGQAKLKESDILQIRKLTESGIDYKEIAKRYPVCSSTINKIINKKIWSHI